MNKQDVIGNQKAISSWHLTKATLISPPRYNVSYFESIYSVIIGSQSEVLNKTQFTSRFLGLPSSQPSLKSLLAVTIEREELESREESTCGR